MEAESAKLSTNLEKSRAENVEISTKLEKVQREYVDKVSLLDEQPQIRPFDRNFVL